MIPFLKKFTLQIGSWWKKLVALTKRDGNPMTNEEPPYQKCLNCGTELIGSYCHRCGQYASQQTKMSGFVKEYLKNIFPIERQVIPTLSNLIFHPGHLVKEFCAGRHVSYMHPLKLNLFILLVLLTLFSILGTDSRIQNVDASEIDKEVFAMGSTLTKIEMDEEYLKEVLASPRDTITFACNIDIVDDHKEMLSIVDTMSIHLPNNTTADTLLVAMPHLLIEDEIFICDENNIYHISTQNKMGDSDSRLNQILHLWSTATEAIFNHLPLLILLTIPLLVLPMRRVLKKYNVPRPNLYIFALFYVSLIELVVLALAIASIFVSDFNSTARLLLLAIPTLYLTTILRNTHIGSWWRALLAATFINFVYIASCAAIMFTLILTAVIYYYF